jgi:ribonuclease Z
MSMHWQILGCGSAVPLPQHHPSAQILHVGGKSYLLDCGEGTQVRFKEFGVNGQQVDAIAITHLHGDHVYGLPGLLSSWHLLGRSKALTLIGPPDLEAFIRPQLELSRCWLEYPLHFVACTDEPGARVFEDEAVQIFSHPLTHSIPTWGYKVVTQRGMRRIDAEKARAAGVESCDMRRLQLGMDVVTRSGATVLNASVTLDPRPPLQFAYITDTAPLPSLVDFVRGVHVLYHESTFLTSHGELAQKSQHSTAAQAAQIASAAEVGTLCLGHYSVRYGSSEPFVEEALEIFPRVVAGYSGMRRELTLEGELRAFKRG